MSVEMNNILNGNMNKLRNEHSVLMYIYLH
jgi:hypothetical protein